MKYKHEPHSVPKIERLFKNSQFRKGVQSVCLKDTNTRKGIKNIAHLRPHANLFQSHNENLIQKMNLCESKRRNATDCFMNTIENDPIYKKFKGYGDCKNPVNYFASIRYISNLK